MEWMKRSSSTVHPDEIVKRADRFLSNNSVAMPALGRDKRFGEWLHHRFTTPEMKQYEDVTFETIKKLQERTACGLCHEADVRRVWHKMAGEGKELNDDQIATLLEACLDGLGISTVVGLPGSGKTTVFRAVREVMHDNGYRVSAACTSASAAKVIASEGGFDRYSSMAKLLFDLERGGYFEITEVDSADKLDRLHAQLDGHDGDLQKMKGKRVHSAKLKKAISVVESKRYATQDQIGRLEDAPNHKWKWVPYSLNADDVIIVDEAGMVETRHWHRLIRQIEKSGAKLLVLGDPEQLQAVGAGGGLHVLEQFGGVLRLTETMRTEEEWERQAQTAWHAGGDGAARSLDDYVAHDRIRFTDTRKEAREQVFDGYWADRQLGLDNCDDRLSATRCSRSQRARAATAVRRR